MKPRYPVFFYYILLLLSLYSFSQSTLKINNITKNQQVSGVLMVKLDTIKLKDYRFVSYFVDDTFLSTVYHLPFTFQFDTRDFKNGKHTLHVKAFRECSLLNT